MNIIEKLEELHSDLVALIGNIDEVKRLRAIIEEYENQEPSAWKYRYHEEGDWIISKDRDLKTEGWVREQYPNFTIFPLFTRPPLSDETVKD